jgi:hypothetical protein
VYPTTGGFVIDVTVAAEPTSGGLVLLALGWLLFFPVALICALLAYQDWQKRQAELLAAAWGPVARQIAAPFRSAPLPYEGQGPAG